MLWYLCPLIAPLESAAVPRVFCCWEEESVLVETAEERVPTLPFGILLDEFELIFEDVKPLLLLDSARGEMGTLNVPFMVTGEGDDEEVE